MKKNKDTKKNKKNRKKLITIVLCVFAVVILAAGVGMTYHMIKKGKNSVTGDSDGTGFHELEEGESLESLENLEVKVISSDDYVEPASGTLDIEKIQGFKTETDENASEDGKTDETVITLDDANLTVEAIGSYSGIFIEDGSDEYVSNVAAMLITNDSDRMLQIAEITFQVNDSETAEFKVTNLPAGTSVLVLESNKREYSAEDLYSYGETASGYMEQPTLEEDKFELVTEKGKIILKNKTDESYNQVYVYYKYVQLGGAYLGGITYRTPFENVPAGGEVEAVAGHFNPDSSQIMAVQILE